MNNNMATNLQRFT